MAGGALGAQFIAFFVADLIGQFHFDSVEANGGYRNEESIAVSDGGAILAGGR